MKGKDILCAVDFSESSVEALRWSFDLALRTKKQVIVLYCYHLMAAMHDSETILRKRRIENEASIKFREFEQTYLAGSPVSYQFIMEAGYAHFRMEMYLAQHPVGLVVVGRSVIEHFDEHKSPGFDKFIKSTRVPVVVVPHKVHHSLVL